MSLTCANVQGQRDEPHLDDSEKLPSLAGFNLLDFQIDVPRLVLRCGRLELEVQGHHGGVL